MTATVRKLCHAVIAVSALILCACQGESPIVSGEVQVPGAASRALSSRQVELLNLWLVEHRSGWTRFVLATPPPTSSMSVTMHRSDNELGQLDFFSQEGWRGALVYRGGEPRDNRQGAFGVDQVDLLRQELQKLQ